jgi:hypothetical protein
MASDFMRAHPATAPDDSDSRTIRRHLPVETLKRMEPVFA